MYAIVGEAKDLALDVLEVPQERGLADRELGELDAVERLVRH